MTISYVGQGAASAITTGTTPAYPTLSAGDRLILATFSSSTTRVADPTGWGVGTPMVSAGGVNCLAWTKVAAGSETGTITMTGFTGGTRGVAFIVGYRGSRMTPSISFSFGTDTDTTSTQMTTTCPPQYVQTNDWLVGAWCAFTPSGTFNANMTSLSFASTGISSTSTSRFNSRTGSNTACYGGIDAATTAGGSGGTTFFGLGSTIDGATAAGVCLVSRLTEAPVFTGFGMDARVS